MDFTVLCVGSLYTFTLLKATLFDCVIHYYIFSFNVLDLLDVFLNKLFHWVFTVFTFFSMARFCLVFF